MHSPMWQSHAGHAQIAQTPVAPWGERREVRPRTTTAAAARATWKTNRNKGGSTPRPFSGASREARADGILGGEVQPLSTYSSLVCRLINLTLHHSFMS